MSADPMSTDNPESMLLNADGGESEPTTRTHEFFRTCRNVADPAVDVIAALAIMGLAFSQASEATIQVAAAAIASVALGKRYMGMKR